MYERKRHSLVYRRKNMNQNNNIYEKENNLSKHITNINENFYSNNSGPFKTNPDLKNNKNKNISLKYGKEFPFYKIENSNNKNYLIFQRNKKNIKEKFFYNILKTNNNFNNFLTDLSNDINAEINYTDNYADTIDDMRINKTNEKNKIRDNNDKFLNSNNTLDDINISNHNSNESNLNNSVFIKKKPMGKFIRNNSAEQRFIKKNIEESFNDINNKKNDNSPNRFHELNLLKKENNQTSINNSNININISINNNFLTERINNKNKEKNNNELIKIKDKNIKDDKEKLQRKSINNTLKMFNKENINNNYKNIKKFNDNSINTKLYNLEDILLIIQKFELIRDKYNIFSNNINKYKPKELLEYINMIRIKIYDLYKFYMSCSIEGSPQNLFSSNISRNCLQYYSTILVLTIGLCYVITQKIKTTMDYHGKLLILLNLQEKAFMIYSDAIIRKLRNNYQKNIWVIEIIKKLKNQLISNADTVNHILQIKILSSDSYKIINDILMNIYILDDMKSNEQELYLYNNFYNKDFNYLTHFSTSYLEETFDKNIFKAINLRSNYANIASLKYSNKNNNNNKPIKTKNINNITKAINNKYQTYKNIKRSSNSPYLNFPPTKEYTLVLDLDETMISFKFTEFNQGLGKLHLRPGLEEFLEEIKKYYEIIVFTSGTKDYAEAILNIIEHKNKSKYFDGLLYREHTTLIGKKYIKDLSKLGRDLSKTIIVDNLPQSFKFQRENGILINSFYGDNMNDRALYELKRILINIYREKKDVRNSINKYKEDIITNVTCIDKYVGEK